MPRLPSSQNVPQVHGTRDPGVQVPAVKSTTGIVAEEFSPAIKKLAEISLRQDNRRDTIERSSLINQYNEEVNKELMRVNTESDLSREDVLNEFGSFMTKRRQELIESHQGSKDSQALLETRLQDVGSGFTGRAAGLSAQIGRDKVKTRFKDAINPLVQRAGQNPTRENIDGLLLDLETQLDDLKGALDPMEEESSRRGAQEEIALAAVDSLITRGRVEQAEGLIDIGGVGKYLSSQTLRQAQKNIETIRFEREKISRTITQAETVMGRPLTQDERAQLIGLAPKAKVPTERELRTKQLIERGLSKQLSEDIAAKDVKIVGPDNFGNFFSVNIATNERRHVGESDKKAISSALGIEAAEEGETEPAKEVGTTRSLEEDVKAGTGPFAKIQAGISNVFGPLDASKSFFEDTTTARQRIRTFNQTIKTALVNNPRFPVAEQKIVQDALPDVEQFFKDPDTAVADLKQLKNTLTDFKTSKKKEVGKKNITSERRGELADQISRLDEVLSLMTFDGKKLQSKKTGDGGYTQEDIEFTAKKHGITVDEVKSKLGIP